MVLQGKFGTALVLAAAGAAGAARTMAQDITRPGNTVAVVGATFPPAEAMAQAIDNTANTKYLNFGITSTGFVVTPTGPGVPTVLTIVTANDHSERDPTSYTLEGSNDGTSFSPIASGTIVPPTARFALAEAVFANSTTYAQYRVVFPTVRSSGTANSMQVAEVQLNTFQNILTAGDAISATLVAGQTHNAAEGPAGLIDGTLGTKFNVVGGNLGAIVVNVTPAIGATIVTGVDVFGANDDVAFPNRTPTKLTIFGSNDGTNYTMLFTTSLAQATLNYQDQQFTFANATSYTRYRMTLDPSIAASMQLGEIRLLGTTTGAAPANDLCANAQAVTAGTIATSNFFSTGTDVSSCGNSDGADVWYRYVATATGLVEVNTCGAGTLDTVVSVYPSCAGAEIGCNDNACLGKSRVRFNATNGIAYLIRVAGVDGATGSFALAVNPNPVVHSDVPVPLAYNFNGMVHAGEAGQPDAPEGFRGVSDRAFRVTGTPGSVDVGLEGTGGIPYSVVRQAGVLDLVLLGNRNTVNTSLLAFDAAPDGDNIGIQPTWLANPDLTGAQSTSLSALNLAMGPGTKIGMIFNASNGGTAARVTLRFADNTSVQVNVAAPDWVGFPAVAAPSAGVESQVRLGLFFGTALTDAGAPEGDLGLMEAVFGTASLAAGGLGDVTGRQLASIEISDRTLTNSSLSLFAATIRDAASVSTPATGACCVGASCSGSVTQTDCQAASGTYRGDNSVCEPSPCGGACCVGGVCSLAVNAGACAGAYQGNGIACGSVVCPQPAGVCCRGSTCNATIGSAACIASGAAGALFVNAAGACNASGNAATPCCHSDYNKIGGRNVSDIFAFLTDWFAGSPRAVFGGDGTAGSPAVPHIFQFLTAWFAGTC